MVSIQASSSAEMRKNSTPQLEINSSKKRKFEEPAAAAGGGGGDEETSFEKRSKAAERTKSVFDMELHLAETPLPLEWQRCLDIQSGQIHFYNSRTQTRTCKDPRRSPEPPSSPPHHHMSLELELNLPCDDSVRKINPTDHHHHHLMINNNSVSPKRGGAFSLVDNHKKMKTSSGGLTQNLSWLAVEMEDEKQHEEMVATVCMRCHMLVMLCKSSPSCPNCKFMHPPDQGPPKLFKQSLSLLC